DAAAAGLARLGQPRLDQVFGADLPLGGQVPGQRVPATRRIAELGRPDRLVGEAPAAQVLERRLAGLRTRQHRVVEGDGRLSHGPSRRTTLRRTWLWACQVLTSRSPGSYHPVVNTGGGY